MATQLLKGTDMYTALIELALKLLGIFLGQAAEKQAWEKAIAQRMRELDASSDEDSKLRTEYDTLVAKLKAQKK